MIIRILILIMYIYILINALRTFKVSKDFFNPEVVLGFVWCSYIFIYILFIYMENPISMFTLFVIEIYLLLMQAGIFIGDKKFFKSSNKRILKEESIKLNNKINNFILLGMIVWISLYFMEYFKIVRTINIEGTILYKIKITKYLMRIGEIEEPLKFKLLIYLSVFFQQYFYFLYNIKTKYSNTITFKRIGLILLINLTYILSSGSRAPLLGLLMVIVIFHTKNKKIIFLKFLKNIIFRVALFIPIFLFLGNLMKKGATVVKGGTIIYLKKYIFGSLTTFDWFLNNDYQLTYGKRIFRTIYAILYKVNISEPPISIVQKFSNISLSSNLYTIFKPFIQDFDLIGGMFFIFMYGYMYGYIYRKSKTSMLYGHVNILLVPTLIMSFSDETIFKNLSLWIQIIFYLNILYNTNLIGKKLKNK